MIVPVIMAGGSGSRLWPISRQQHPKQFLPLVGDLSMLQLTIKRISGLVTDVPQLICNEQHRFLAAEQLRQIGIEDATILLESEGRNTAPAIALAAIMAMKNGDDPVLLVLAADHYIANVAAFHESVLTALPLAESGKLVVFGIEPTSPETGYGYIQQGDSVGAGGFFVAQFVEKPDLPVAESYLEQGGYLWNSGMFMFRASSFLKELDIFHPEIVSTCNEALQKGEQDLHFVRAEPQVFSTCPDLSVDYAVMEKTSNSVVVPMSAGWSDIGSWSALWELSARDLHQNVLKGDVLAHDTHCTYLQADSRLLAAVGVDNLIIIETKDSVLVVHKDRVQEVKVIVDMLKAQGRPEPICHREVYRPWGTYDSIDKGTRYQVKRISVRPGAKLSVQMHHHRAEHWIVVSGTAKVTNGTDTYLVTENQSTYIPIGQVHALENPGKVPLELIEVQSGSYLGEDDIVRFEDLYGRT